MSGLYNYQWQQYRVEFLKAHPFCAMHLEQGKYVAATVVDHIVPHRGDLGLFWEESNHQALCKHCHDSHKQRQEKQGGNPGCRADGVPLDKTHHWHK